MKVLIYLSRGCIVAVADTECVTSNAYFSSDSAYRLQRCHLRKLTAGNMNVALSSLN